MAPAARMPVTSAKVVVASAVTAAPSPSAPTSANAVPGHGRPHRFGHRVGLPRVVVDRASVRSAARPTVSSSRARSYSKRLSTAPVSRSAWPSAGIRCASSRPCHWRRSLATIQSMISFTCRSTSCGMSWITSRSNSAFSRLLFTGRTRGRAAACRRRRLPRVARSRAARCPRRRAGGGTRGAMSSR